MLNAINIPARTGRGFVVQDMSWSSPLSMEDGLLILVSPLVGEIQRGGLNGVVE